MNPEIDKLGAEDALSNISAATYAVNCIMFSMETRGHNPDGLDSLAIEYLADRVEANVNRLKTIIGRMGEAVA